MQQAYTAAVNRMRCALHVLHTIYLSSQMEPFVQLWLHHTISPDKPRVGMQPPCPAFV